MTWGEKCEEGEDKDLSQGRNKMRNLQQLTAITVPPRLWPPN